MTKNIISPVAKKIPHVHKKHGHQRLDHYHWMRERDTPEVIEYLNQENEYYDQMTAHTDDLKESLFQEIKSRIKEDDESVPYLLNGYWYYSKMVAGESYPCYYRRREGTKKEELMFDVNKMAEGHDYFKITSLNISPDNVLVAYGVDTVGRREYDIFIKNLETGEVLDLKLGKTTGGSVWANDNSTLFYTRKDPQTLRANQIFKHRLGSDPMTDFVIFEEQEEAFHCYVYKTMSERYIMIKSSSTLSDEVRFIDANYPDSTFKIIQERQENLEYSVSHYKEHFYIMTNADGAKNFKVVTAPITAAEKENWSDLIAHREDVLLEDIDIFEQFLVISDRFNGLNRIRIKSWDDTIDYFIPFDNETYTAYTSANFQYESTKLRFTYNPMTAPPSVVEYDMENREWITLKTQPIEDPTFNAADYVSERVWATAEDGKKIPVSLVYKKQLKNADGNPTLQYGYGSYGSTIDPYFSISRISLLNRGFVFAIAHIRGGEYLGRDWYEDGKMFNKRNTFTDFIACSKFLIENKYTLAGHLYASGGSAGGLLMGTIMNMAPELYRGILAAVPFVDVVTTMLDDTIPLTTGEYDEWGNPNIKDSYDYMLSYSPYDNTTERNYPNLLITTGYHDSQVQYWEPAKWIARLREKNQSKNTLLFRTDMSSGHSGASGRYDALREVARDFAFLLDLESNRN
jgi:oligopeptidase B